MPSLRGTDLAEVVKLLKARGVRFYHACQLLDFAAYIDLGGIPSRNLMDKSGCPYTRFHTDAKDRTNGVWEKVFGNLYDFGFGFAVGQWSDGKAPVPNPFGPILIIAEPEILFHAEDVAICLRSAGGLNFDREAETLSSAAEVDRLFVHPFNSPDKDRLSFIRFSRDLGREFSDRFNSANRPSTYNPEVSCTVSSERLPLSNLYKIVVDRYYHNHTSLLKRVARIAARGALQVELMERGYRDGRREILTDIARVLQDCFVPARELINCVELDYRTREWAERVCLEGLEWQYERFATYLREGTLLVVAKNDLPN